MPRASKSNAAARATAPDKRELILRAAIKTFAAKGFFHAKVSDIASEAGIADGTVYLYFRSKDEILRSVFDQAMSVFIDEGREQLADLTDPVEKLSRIARLHLKRLGDDRDLAIVFQVELRGSIKFMQEFSSKGFAEYLEFIRQTIEEGQKKGLFRTDLKPLLCAKILYGALDEMVTNWILSDGKKPLAPLADEVLQIFLGGMLLK